MMTAAAGTYYCCWSAFVLVTVTVVNLADGCRNVTDRQIIEPCCWTHYTSVANSSSFRPAITQSTTVTPAILHPRRIWNSNFEHIQPHQPTIRVGSMIMNEGRRRLFWWERRTTTCFRNIYSNVQQLHYETLCDTLLYMRLALLWIWEYSVEIN